MVNIVNIYLMDGVNSVNGSALPPSAQALLLLLDDGVPRTFKDITVETDIAPRTIRYALKRLKDRELIVEKFNFRDARQIIYQKRCILGTEEDRSPVFAL